MEELMIKIENDISKLDNYLKKISLDDDEQVEKNKKIIEDNKDSENFQYLVELDISELKKILPDTFVEDINSLEMYIMALKRGIKVSDINNNPQYVGEIKILLEKIHIYLQDRDKQNKQSKSVIDGAKKQRDKLEKLNKKMLSLQDVKEDDFDKVLELVSDMDKNSAIDLLVSFGRSVINTKKELLKKGNIEEEIETEIFEENEDKDAIRKQLVDLFKNYNLDFDMLMEKEQKELISYGKIDRIDGILKELKKFNVDLNKDYGYDEILLIRKSRAIVELLLNSNSQIVNELLSLFNNKDMDKIFKLLIENPKRFMNRKRRYRRKGISRVGKNGSFGKPHGHKEDFVKNFQLFTGKGMDAETFCKIKRLPDEPHAKILNSLKIFNMYGFDENVCLSSSSCYCVSTQPADVIDQFIELGCFNYLKMNPSIINLGPDNVDCYRLLYALKYSDLDPSYYFKNHHSKNGDKVVLNNKYLNSNKYLNEINETNCYKKLHKYTALEENNNINDLYEKFETTLKKSWNSNISLALNKNDSIIKELDEKFLVKDIDGNVLLPEIYNFGSVRVRLDTKEEKYRDWGIIISRKKVLRLYNTLLENGIADSLESILFAVTRNSILTKDEYDIIKNELKKIYRKKTLI